MTMDFQKGKGIKTFVRILCFMAFGVGAMANPMDVLNLYGIGFGIVCGLLIGWLFRLFLKGFLSLFNHEFKKQAGHQAIRYAVDEGMLFLAPFAVMLLIAVFHLNWTMTVPFISAGIMAAGTAASMEIGKMQGKQAIKNTVATTIVSFAFSFLWIVSVPFLKRAPSLIEGGVQLIRSLLGGGGL